MSYMRSLEKAFFSGEKGHICPLLLKNYNITLRLYYQSIYAPTIIKMAQLCPSFVNPIHFSHMACQLITPTLLLPPPLKVTNTQHDNTFTTCTITTNINHPPVIYFFFISLKLVGLKLWPLISLKRDTYAHILGIWAYVGFVTCSRTL